MCRWWRTVFCHPWTPNRLCCGSIACTRRTGSCGFTGFQAAELLDDAHPDFDPRLDPKCSWALRHLDRFPVEVMRADLETLLRVPGIGPTSARRIVSARRCGGTLRFEDLKKLGVWLKRARNFITCGGRIPEGLHFSPATLPCSWNDWSAIRCLRTRLHSCLSLIR